MNQMIKYMPSTGISILLGLIILTGFTYFLPLKATLVALSVSLLFTGIAWLVAREHLKKPDPSPILCRDLPNGYFSWFKFYMDNIHGKRLVNDEVFVPVPYEFYMPEKSSGNETHTIQLIKFDIDYVKARVMEEIINHIPNDRDECQMIMHGITYLGPGAKANKLKEKMFQLLKLLSR